MPPEIGEALTRKIGPLPAWAWGAVVGGGILIARVVRGGGSSGSASVNPVALDSGAGALPDAGAGVSDAAQNALGYITLPNGSVVLDRPTDDVTILPGAGIPPAAPGTPGTPAAPTGLVLTIKNRINLFKTPGKPHTSDATSGSYRVSKVKISGKWWYKILGTKSGAPSSRVGQYIPAYTNATGYSVATGDTYGSQADTVGVPVVPIPAMPPLPLGNVLALPAYDGPDYYKGPTFARGPIASSARIVMPPVNGGPTGSVVVPSLPAASGRAPSSSGRRLLDPTRRVIDRLTPDVPPTTLRPRLRISTRIRTQVLNVSGRNASG